MNDVLKAGEEDFLRRHGFSDPLKIVSVSGGANNRLFRVAGKVDAAILKRYFRSATDSRERLQAELNFYAHATRVAEGFVPRVLGWAKDIDCGLFAFISGRKLHSEEIGTSQIERAAEFIERLNSGARAAVAPAADSSFTIEESRKSIQCRMDLLAVIKPETDHYRSAVDLARREILPRWKEVSRQLTSLAGSDFACCLPQERVLSPSDFGFHNALCDESGTVLFFDFEYAGEDDPAKMICDFFSQPEIPVPGKFLSLFTERVLALLPKARQNACRYRVEALRSATHLKWCGIMLNEFLPAGRSSRAFALSEEELQLRQERQIGKVAAYIKMNLG